MKNKIQVIRLNRIDELLEEFETFKNDGELFSDFIKVSKCLYDDKPAVYDLEEVEEEHLKEVIEK